VWPDHSKAEHGEYNLTFDQANRRLAAPAGLLPSSTVEVIVVRDPDRSNGHTIVIDGKASADATSRPVRVITHDLDLGANEITPAWVAAELGRAQALSAAAAAHARDVIAMYADDNNVDVP
jgi:hypothetical protein